MAELSNMPRHKPDGKSANLQTSQAEAAELLNVSTRTTLVPGPVAKKPGPYEKRESVNTRLCDDELK